MLRFEPAGRHRSDIQGLRALAVLAAIFFHFGVLPNGFVGVDVFFVISGYLITGNIWNELSEGRFSLGHFYLRRVRRIVPLAALVSAVALTIGLFVMLPDDAENLAQSVIATNFFANNILQAITTQNYWDVVNEYKPLMHTWSLGVEEQYYLLFPPLVWLVGKTRPGWLRPMLIALAAGSVALVCSPFPDFAKFYLLPFRFYQLAAGGIVAVSLKNRLIQNRYSAFLLALFGLVVLVNWGVISREVRSGITVAITAAFLATANHRSGLTSALIENRLAVAIGTISYSLYMWQQVLLAYGRYALFEHVTAPRWIGLLLLTFALSALSYGLIEKPFRDEKRVSHRRLLATLTLAYLALNGTALYVYSKAGVLRDVPELDIVASRATRGMHGDYNERVNALGGRFGSGEKTRVLIIGDSFARDWANLLMESRHASIMEMVYVASPETRADFMQLQAEADVIFYPTPERAEVRALGIDETKMYVVGTKNFGISNGLFYNHRAEGYFEQRDSLEPGYRELNLRMRRAWGPKYLDYLEKLLDEANTVPVFTPSKKFISPDGRHLTPAGARYLAVLFDEELVDILTARPKPR